MLVVQEAPAPYSEKTHNEEMPIRESLIQHVELRLRQSGYSELGNLEVSEGHGRVLLRGQVRTYFLKQLAQTLILSLPEVTALENQLVVS